MSRPVWPTHPPRAGVEVRPDNVASIVEARAAELMAEAEVGRRIVAMLRQVDEAGGEDAVTASPAYAAALGFVRAW